MEMFLNYFHHRFHIPETNSKTQTIYDKYLFYFCCHSLFLKKRIMRIEKDFLGNVSLQDDVLYGIHSVRAKENFPDESLFHKEWYKAIGMTKLACYNTYKKFKIAAKANYDIAKLPIQFFDDEIIDALIKAAHEIADGEYFNQFIVPAIQGGAGTSINMNVNEIITNLALISMGYKPGNYSVIDPIEHANIYQSTNDVIPSSLKIAVIKLLNKLEESINRLRFKIEEIEKKNRDTLRLAYTQMQEAVPSSYAMLFSSYNDTLSRDWWRVSKCFERIKVVNIGGSAVGTGIAVPRFFIMEIVPELQAISNQPIARADNLSDATGNLDSFVEVHGILKAHAVNLEKMVNDIRLLSSDLVAPNDIVIPKRQVGSSIMPGKVNPVIPEFVISLAHKIYSNDSLITSLASQACLDLNAYLPSIGNAIIESIKLLMAANESLTNNLFNNIQINSRVALDKLYKSPTISTALSPYIGYNKAAEIAKMMKSDSLDIFQANEKLNILSDEKLKNLLQPHKLLQLGFSLKDL